MSWDKLERYTNLLEAECTKCGAKNAAGGEQTIQSQYFEECTGDGLKVGEHIRRTCWRCGYVWNEAPLDDEADDRPPPTPTPTDGEDVLIG